MLGIHADRFPGGDAEKGGIKLIDPVNKAAPLHVLGKRMVGVWVVVQAEIPALRRDLADHLPPFPE